MTKVINLADHRPLVNDSVVSLLEQHLERAKAGETAGIAIAATTRDGYGQTCWSRCENTVLLLGTVSLLATRIGIEMDSDMEDAPPVG